MLITKERSRCIVLIGSRGGLGNIGNNYNLVCLPAPHLVCAPSSPPPPPPPFATAPHLLLLFLPPQPARVRVLYGSSKSALLSGTTRSRSSSLLFVGAFCLSFSLFLLLCLTLCLPICVCLCLSLVGTVSVSLSSMCTVILSS